MVCTVGGNSDQQATRCLGIKGQLNALRIHSGFHDHGSLQKLAIRSAGPGHESLAAHLVSSGAGTEQAGLIAHISGGRPGYALRLLADSSALAQRTERLDDIHALLRATRVDKFKYAEKLAHDREALRETLLVWTSYWRDVLLRASGAATPVANLDYRESIAKLAGHLGLSRARRLVRDLETAQARLERNVNARLLVEVLLLDWPRV